MDKLLSFLEEHKVLIGIFLAFLGYLAKYFHDVSLAAQKNKLDRLNQQLKLLYGPLLCLSQASNAAWKAFRVRHRPGGAFFRKGDPPSVEDLAAYRLWMEKVFMPYNREMVNAILKNGDLLENGIPKEFLTLVAYVIAMEPLLAKWEAGNFSQHEGLLNFPASLDEHVKSTYETLIMRQRKLLRF
jgi:hypothetical protein